MVGGVGDVGRIETRKHVNNTSKIGVVPTITEEAVIHPQN
jgi:hypothetical protein